MLQHPLQYTKRERLQKHQIATKSKSFMQKRLILTQTKSCQRCVQHAWFLYKTTRQEKDKLYDPEGGKKRRRKLKVQNYFDSVMLAMALKSQTIEK